jgi:hypothetical protein
MVAFEVSRLRKALNTKRVDARVSTVEPVTNKQILKNRLPMMPNTRPKRIRETPKIVEWSPMKVIRGLMLKS